MPTDADAVADAYVAFCHGDVDRLLALTSSEFFDHVSGRTGKGIWILVDGWIAASFGDRAVDLNGVGVTEDRRVMVWITMRGTHIGSAFPWMRGRPATGRAISSAQLHVFRVDRGLIVEHWAVRDDLRVLETIDAP